ncbi:hypothetical protein RUND412_002813 [Rhizina undulata]
MSRSTPPTISDSQQMASQAPPQIPSNGMFLLHRPVSSGMDAINQGFRFSAPVSSRKQGGLEDKLKSINHESNTGGTRESDRDIITSGEAEGLKSQGMSNAAPLPGLMPSPIFKSALGGKQRMPVSRRHDKSVTPPTDDIPSTSRTNQSDRIFHQTQSSENEEEFRGRSQAREKRKRPEQSYPMPSSSRRPHTGAVEVSSTNRFSNMSFKERLQISAQNEARMDFSDSSQNTGRPSKRMNSGRAGGRDANGSVIDSRLPVPTNEPMKIAGESQEIIILDDEDDTGVKSGTNGAEVLNKETQGIRHLNSPLENMHPSRRAPDPNSNFSSGGALKQHFYPQRGMQAAKRQPITGSHQQPLSNAIGKPQHFMAIDDVGGQCESTISSRITGATKDRIGRNEQGTGIPKTKRSHLTHKVAELGETPTTSKPCTPIPPVLPAVATEDVQSTGEQTLAAALTTLTAEKKAVEKKLYDARNTINTQTSYIASMEGKSVELKSQIEKYKSVLTDFKRKFSGLEKFVEGLGQDYNMLNDKNVQFKNKLNEISREKAELAEDRISIRDIVAKTEKSWQEWSSIRTTLKEAQLQIEKLQGTLKVLHEELSEKAGLLAVERDRTQSLECQMLEDRKKGDEMFRLIEESRDELMAKLEEIQKGVTSKVELEGDLNRDLVEDCIKHVNALKDKDKMMPECFLKVENTIKDAADSVLGIFQETQKMNADAISFGDGHIRHLENQITDLKSELNDMREKYKQAAIASADKKATEEKLKDSQLRCETLEAQIGALKEAEAASHERISTIEKILSAVTAQPKETPAEDNTIQELRRDKLNAEKECKRLAELIQEATAETQLRVSQMGELENELEALKRKHAEVMKRVENFETEKKEYIAQGFAQREKERIQFETNANSFRHRENAKLENRIKTLETQKAKLEAENGKLKAEKNGRENSAKDSGSEKDNLKKENKELQARFQDTAQKCAEFQEEAQRLNDELKQALDETRSLRTAIKEREKTLEETLTEQEVLKAKLTNSEAQGNQFQAKAEEEITGLRTSLRDAMAKEEALREELEKTNATKETLAKEKMEEMEQANIHKATLEILSQELSITNDVRRTLEEKNAEMEQRVESLLAERETARGDSVKSENLIKTLTKAHEEAVERLRVLDSAREDARRRNEILEIEVEKLTSALAQLNARLGGNVNPEIEGLNQARDVSQHPSSQTLYRENDGSLVPFMIPSAFIKSPPSRDLPPALGEHPTNTESPKNDEMGDESIVYETQLMSFSALANSPGTGRPANSDNEEMLDIDDLVEDLFNERHNGLNTKFMRQGNMGDNPGEEKNEFTATAVSCQSFRIKNMKPSCPLAGRINMAQNFYAAPRKLPVIKDADGNCSDSNYVGDDEDDGKLYRELSPISPTRPRSRNLLSTRTSPPPSAAITRLDVVQKRDAENRLIRANPSSMAGNSKSEKAEKGGYGSNETPRLMTEKALSKAGFNDLKSSDHGESEKKPVRHQKPRNRKVGTSSKNPNTDSRPEEDGSRKIPKTPVKKGAKTGRRKVPSREA